MAKIRVRKAPSVRQKSEAARTKAGDGKKTSKLPNLGLSRVAKTLGVIFWPLKVVLKRLVPRYFINSWKEVRQVTWPSRTETWRLTGAVLIFAIVFGSLVAGVDKVLDEVFKKVILK